MGPRRLRKTGIKWADCPHRRFLPVTDDLIRSHLSGCSPDHSPFIAGVYPMLLDQTCFFLAADFDKDGWREDAAAFVETCRLRSVPCALERSRSGNGAHVWLFFEEAIPAALARKLGSLLLTETMERRPEIGLDSYDRSFPNQDTLPDGGFGNLIALPLQKEARERDHSVFLDAGFNPHPDQWAYVATIRKIERARIEQLVCDAERRGPVVGVRFPTPMKTNQSPGRRRPRAASKISQSRASCRAALNSCSATRSTSPTTPCRPLCAIAFCG